MKNLKTSIRVFFILFWLQNNDYRSQNFTWVKGSNIAGPTGVYGTMGIPSNANNPGGRHGCATWKDAAGNLWLFGGEGYAMNNTLCWLSDLWKYNPVTNQWTWIKGSNTPNAIGNYGTQGVAAMSNEPGAREFTMTWTDPSGNFWLFGGDGFAANNTFGRLGDLWKYDPTTNMWTWMKGFNTLNNNGVYGALNVTNAANMPGSRLFGSSWSDGAGKLYLFGGRGYAVTGGSGYLNDLWVYTIATNNWMWIGGTNQSGQSGSYGTLGTPSATNIPGGRAFTTSWTDGSGNFFLHGGLGLPATIIPGYLNDLWKYNPANGTWTWLSGTNAANVNGLYGTLGVPSLTNAPGGRAGSAGWTDLSGSLWLFGGLGWSAAAPINGALNDLWKYSPPTNEWTWIKGTSTVNVNGNYGIQGVPNANNIPGGRFYNDFWRDNNGKFWLFGGEGYDVNSLNPDHMNDLWSFAAPCSFDSLSLTPAKPACSGNTISLKAYNQTTASVSWFSSPNSPTAIAGGSAYVTPPLGPVATPSIITYYAQASSSCTLSPRASVDITVNPSPNVIATSSSPTVCAGKSVTLIALGANSYTWSTGTSTNALVVTPSVSSSYTVTGENGYGCLNNSVTFINLVTANLIISSTNSVLCSKNTATLTANGATTYSWNTTATVNIITVSPTVTTTYTVSGIDANGCSGSNTFVQTVSPCAGIVDFTEDAHSFYIYPNPAQNEFVIQSANSSESFNLEIYNLIGQKVIEVNKLISGKMIQTQLPLGVYYYQITSQNKTQSSGKLVIEK